jgi:hypothetical protein
MLGAERLSASPARPRAPSLRRRHPALARSTPRQADAQPVDVVVQRADIVRHRRSIALVESRWVEAGHRPEQQRRVFGGAAQHAGLVQLEAKAIMPQREQRP